MNDKPRSEITNRVNRVQTHACERCFKMVESVGRPKGWGYFMTQTRIDAVSICEECVAAIIKFIEAGVR